MKHTLLLTVFAALSMSLASSGADGELPKVLIIGDSISIAYTPHVIKMMTADAKVVHNRGNAGPTLRGLASIDAWLGKTKWDVIHFNWGLWDMYRWRYEKYDQSPEAYERNLEKLVERLKKTNAKLIWATTTPPCLDIAKGTKIQITEEQETKYQSAALRVMKKHNVKVNDLRKVIMQDRKKYAKADNDVHFNQAGSIALAKQVVEAIKAEL